jgi:arsenate reductase
MAEGFARKLKGDLIDSFSAGIAAHGLDPYAVKVMQETGVDISGQRSKTLNELRHIEFDYVITLCGHADENCPVFPANIKVIHHDFDDPFKLAKNAKTEDEVLCIYRGIRDQIKTFIETFPEPIQ